MKLSIIFQPAYAIVGIKMKHFIGKFRQLKIAPRSKIALLGLILLFNLFASVFSVAPYKATPAYALGESYIFYYDKGDAAAIKQGLSDLSFDNLGKTSVYLRGGNFGSTPLGFTYDTSSSDLGSLGAGSNNATYDVTYFCANKKPEANPSDGSIAISLAASLPLNDKFDQTKSFNGTVSFTSASKDTTQYVNGGRAGGSTTSGTQDLAISDVPSSCLPSGLSKSSPTKNIALQNYALLGSSAQKNWPGVTSSSKQNVTANATANQGSGGNGGSSDTTPSCEASGFSLSWVLCPIIEGAAKASDGIYHNLIQPMLKTQPINLNDPTHDPTHLYDIWTHFRIYGDIFLLIALLVIVFGESIGGGLVDAYTAKKILPRLLVAAIAINLSIYLVALAVDVTNIVGGGIAALIEAPFKSAEAANGAYTLHIGGTTGDLGMTTLIAGVGAAWIGGGELFAFLFVMLGLPVLFTLIAILTTVILRQGLIILLILFSPVAFALYCLPNTEKYFRQWWELLVKTLIVYPLISVLFAIGNVLSVTINSTASGITGSFTAILSVFALFAPLFLIPFSFRIAGGLLARYHELATTSRKRAHEGILGNVNDQNSLRNRSKRRMFAKYTAAESRAINSAKGPEASFFQRRRAGLINGLDGRVNERQSRYTREAAEIANMISATGNDDDHYAANWFSYGRGQVAPSGLKDGNGKAIAAGTVFDSERFFDAKGREINGNYAQRSAAKLAHNQHEAGRSLEYPVRKIQTDDDIANFRRGFAATALRQGWTNGEMQGVHAASTFEHKDKFPELWYEKPRLEGDHVEWDQVSDNTPAGRANRAGMVSELHKARQSFQLGTVRDASARAWNDQRNAIQSNLDAGHAPTEQDAVFYAQTNEILDSMVSRGVITREGEAGPEMAASGATPAMQGVLKAMQKNRRYDTAPARDPATGQSSVNQRVIYNTEAVEAAVTASPRLPNGRPSLSRDDAIDAHAAPVQRLPAPGTIGPSSLSKTVDVTGDAERSSITTDSSNP